MNLLMDDPNVAAGIFFSNFRDGYYISESIYRVMEKVSRQTTKPIVMANCYSDLAHNDLCKSSSDCGFPFIDGPGEALRAIKHLLNYRNFKLQQKNKSTIPSIDENVIEKWRNRLSSHNNGILSEVESLTLLSDFAIPVPDHGLVTNEKDLLKTASDLGYPLVLKTAAAGINHKSDVGGVMVNIQNKTELVEHYEDFVNRLGSDVLLMRMIDKGTEVGLGIVNDPQFGPFVMVAAGGVLIELLSEHALAPAPVSPIEADEMLAAIKLNKLLNGIRGEAPGNRQTLIDIIVLLSVIAFELKGCLKEIDINPVIVNQKSATVVDALIITHS